MPTQLELAAPDIIKTFEAADLNVFSRKDLAGILLQNRDAWLLGQTTLEKFIQFLLQRGLKKRTLRSDRYSPITKFVWGDASSFELGLAIRLNSYLSHGTAVFLHGLTDQFPSVVYSNREQSEKPQTSRSRLRQEGIDRAFKNRQRQSGYIYKEGRWRYILLSGKQTNRLEVSTVAGPNGERLEATKIERTLIDIVVRPTYAGGIFEVLRAFESAKDRFSTNFLVETLKKLNYIYPYHQAIGFYMERAGYSAQSIDAVSGLGTDFNFYLAHGADNTEFDARWRLFHPQGF